VLEAEGKLKRQRDRSGDSLATEFERKQGTAAPKHHPTRHEFLVPHLLKCSRNAIAEDADITPSSLQRWHEGKSRLSPDNLSKLAKRLKVDARTIPNE
jgi:transcriptional regulator with XRE-family HTH domain